MPGIKINFPNEEGTLLAGSLEMPVQAPEYYALFAHCFTCSKDVAAASRITRGLAGKGVAVLRFDFTGLGNSDGDFANTNFSSNLMDLVYAARYLEENYAAPALLIGHSLGGAAVLAVAESIASVKAVVTIGAPATADHVEHLFSGVKERIVADDEAPVCLAGREFTIKKQFLEDIATHNTVEHISRLGKALLVFHSPVDEIVSIDEAAKIYSAARHPKSFISLDKADHLLTDRRDSKYVSEVIAGWIGRYLDDNKVPAEASAGTAPTVETGHVLVTEQNHQFTRRLYTESHQLIADEPVSFGGNNLGPNPYEYLLASLGACTSMTLRMYANRKKFALDKIEVELTHTRVHRDDCETCDSDGRYVDNIIRTISLEGDLNAEERQKLVDIADKCPIHKTLLNDITISTRLVD